MTQQLFRPVGLYELRLIHEAAYHAFPPRLDHQPIFYPVLNREYAIQIARDWNTTDPASGFMGAVTAFDIQADYLRHFPVQTVGNRDHQELWIPAEELPTFHTHLVGTIRVEQVFYGSQFNAERLW
jgi:hypothetical protein